MNYAPGTWHFPVLVLVPQQDFLVIDRAGPGNNLEEFQFAAGSEASINVGLT